MSAETLPSGSGTGPYEGWLTLPEVAAVLGLPTHTSLYTTVRRGTLAAVKYKGRVLVSPSVAQRYKEQHSFTRRSRPSREA